MATPKAPKELLDELAKGCKTKPRRIYWARTGSQAVDEGSVERMFGAELTEHLGYDKHAPEGRDSGNSRNGMSGKTIQGRSPSTCLGIARASSSRT